MENPNLLPRFQRQIIDYYLGRPTQFDVPLDLSRVPAFRRQVLELCRRIPYGRTSSYLDLARAVGKPEASRAVGGAMGRNPAPIVIPCHRVLRADGSLGGFSSRSGVREKERLLTLEGVRRPDNRTRPAAASESRPSRREKSTRRSMNQPVSVG
jgi:methylated-DNA-[protein]-cysteine S-methyltransferase